MHITHRSLIGLALLLSVGSAAHAQAPASPAAHWEGTIEIPNRLLNVAVDLSTADGRWVGSMTVVNTSVADVPVGEIAFADASVRFTAKLPGDTTFVGTLSADGQRIAGTVSNAEGGVPFQLTRKGDANVKLPPQSSMLTKPFEGSWQGTLEVQGKSLRIALTMWPAADGRARAMLVALDQGDQKIPVDTVTLEDTRLQLDARFISGHYSGTLGADGDDIIIRGEWGQGGVTLPLSFKRVAADAKKPLER